MRKYLERQIEHGEKLTIMQDRINHAAALGMISMADKAVLDKLLVERANPNDNAPDLREMVVELNSRVKALEELMNNHGDSSEEPTEPDEGGDDTPKYPEWEAWNGYEYKYTGGEIVSHVGKLWENIAIGVPNTWEPGVQGTSSVWKEYTPAS